MKYSFLLLVLFLFVSCAKKKEEVIQVLPPSILTYSTNLIEIERFQPLNFLYPDVDVDNVHFEVSPALPTGLKFNKRTGIISGIPQVVSPLTTYTVFAINEGGRVSFDIQIMISSRPIPKIQYEFSSYSFPRGMQIEDPAILTKTGAEFVSFVIDNPLPLGLNFDTTTGRVSGTPSDFVRSSLFTVTGKTSTGIDIHTSLIINIKDFPPADLIYKQNSIERTVFAQTKGIPFFPAIPELSFLGGAVDSFSISPALPTGMSFDTLTGVISGTSVDMQLNTRYTVTATNTGGSVSKDLFIEIREVIPFNLTYNLPTISLRKNVSIVNQIIPNYSGGRIASFSINPALPAGLIFNPANGEISGKPTEKSNVRVYTVIGQNNGGVASTTFNLLVRDLPPQNLSYPIVSEIFVKNSPILNLSPTSNGGEISEYTINNTLPVGLTLNPLTGVISGTPIAISGISSYTVNAINSEGISSYSFFIAVKDEAPINLTYSNLVLVLEKGQEIPNNTPSNQKGGITSYTSNKLLPLGLTLNPLTGIISGTPTGISNEDIYRVTGKNATGEVYVDMRIVVNDKIPSNLQYGTNSFIFNRGNSVGNLNPTNAGGTIVLYRVKNGSSLPSGLLLNETSGVISGVPGTRIVNQSTIIQGINSGGVVEATLDFSVNDYIPSGISYGTDLINLTFGIDLGSDGLFPSSNGGTVDQYTISPALPLGLTFNAQTGAIMGFPINPNGGSVSNPNGTGLPPEVSPYISAKEYTIVGSNSGGSSSKNVSIRVIPPLPVITIQEQLSIQRGSFGIAIPTVSGGIPSEYVLQPMDLPAGLIFNPTNGTISGIPMNVSPNMQYTVRVRNDGGDSSAKIFIRVTEIPPSNLNYNSFFTDFHGDNNHSVSSTNVWKWNGELIITSAATSITVGGFLYEKGEIFNIDNGLYKIKRTKTGTNNFEISKFTADGVATYPTVYLNPTISGDPVLSWEITPALPAGLVFNNTTGTISGVPTVNTLLINYNITAINSGGTTSRQLALKIKDLPPEMISYEMPLYEFNTGDAFYIPEPLSSGGFITSFSITPALPSFLILNTANGEIRKSASLPLLQMPETTFVINGCNFEGCASTQLKIKLNESKPEGVSYGLDSVLSKDIIYFNEGESLNYLPTVESGGTPLLYKIRSASYIIPNSEFINRNNGVLSSEDYMDDFELIDYSTDDDDGEEEPEDPLIGLEANIGQVGIILNQSTGRITGNISNFPLPYGSLYKLELELSNTNPEKAYSSVFLFINKKPVANAGSNYSGIILSPFSLNGALSSDPDTALNWNFLNSNKGLSVLYSWRLISKPVGSTLTSDSLSNKNSVNPTFVPDVIGNYTWGLIVNDGLINSANESSVIVTVNDQPPTNLRYAKEQTNRNNISNILYNVGDLTNFTLYPESGGGAIVSYSISPPLPSGMTFSTSSGRISGKPISAMAPKNFTITATNSGGSTTSVINIFANLKPIANIVAIDKVQQGNNILLNGTSSSDPDGEHLQTAPYGPLSLKYKWTIKQKPTGSQLNDSSFIMNDSQPSVFLMPDIKGEYIISLRVFDGYLYSDVFDHRFTMGAFPTAITFEDANAQFKSGNYFAYNTNKPVDILIGFNGDTEGLSFNVINLPAGLSFNSATRRITGTPSLPTLPRVIDVSISNYGGTNSSLFHLWINNKPEVSLGNIDHNINLGNTFVYNGSVNINDTDPASSQASPYSSLMNSFLWSLIGVPSNSFFPVITDANGTTPSMTPDVNGSYYMKLKFFDGLADSYGNDTLRVRTNVNPVYDNPVVSRIQNSYIDNYPAILANSKAVLNYYDENSSVVLLNEGGTGITEWKVVTTPELNQDNMDVIVVSGNLTESYPLTMKGTYLFKSTKFVNGEQNSNWLFVNYRGEDIFNTIPSNINSDITLTKENSPYYLQGPTVITNGAKLIVQRGVSIIGENNYIDIQNGTVDVGVAPSMVIIGDSPNNHSKSYLSNLNIITTQNNTNSVLKINKTIVDNVGIFLNSYFGGVPFSGELILEDNIFLELRGDQRLNAIARPVSIKRNQFINSNGFTIESNNQNVNIEENYVYNAKGGNIDDPLIFFLNVKINAGEKINIVKNRFINPNNFSIILNNNNVNQKLNLKNNFWDWSNSSYVDSIRSRVINVDNADIFPFYTTPTLSTPDGRAFH